MKSVFESMGGTYTKSGDYYIPDITLPERSNRKIGKYGRMRHRYLKEHRPVIYSAMILDDTLWDHLAEIDLTCNNRLDVLISGMREKQSIMETPAIYLDMTAEDNLKQQYRVLGLPSFDNIPELLTLVGLENAGKKKAKRFSLGMKQRLGIAIALAGNPDFLVLDEPTNGLDPQGIIEMRELILTLNRERHITVLISSHILDELARLATHYGIIDKGRMLAELSAEELEASCRKCMRIEVSNMLGLTHVLDSMAVDYETLSDTQADIFAKLNISQLTLALAEHDCEVLSVETKDESLESFFIALTGGDSNA